MAPSSGAGGAHGVAAQPTVPTPGMFLTGCSRPARSSEYPAERVRQRFAQRVAQQFVQCVVLQKRQPTAVRVCRCRNGRRQEVVFSPNGRDRTGPRFRQRHRDRDSRPVHQSDHEATAPVANDLGRVCYMPEWLQKASRAPAAFKNVPFSNGMLLFREHLLFWCCFMAPVRYWVLRE